MEKNVYLNEEKYQQANQKVKKIGTVLIIVGLVLLGIGLILIISGFIGFGGQVSNGLEIGQVGVNPSKMFSGVGIIAMGGFLTTPGVFITVAGLVVKFLIGNRREIVSYTTQQVMPVAKEGIDAIAPTVGNVAKEITKGIKEGLNNEKKISSI